MAAATATKATTAPKPTRAAREAGIGVADVASKLGTNPRTLRAFVRTLDLGVGRGERYRWSGMSDPAVKKIVAAWEKAGEAQSE